MTDLLINMAYGLSIHFSADCNMNCDYCYITSKQKQATELNKKIRAALADGSFFQHIKEAFDNAPGANEHIETYALWGAEPTINATLFEDFNTKMFDYFPNMRSMSFSTNGWCGSNMILKYFIKPIADYANSHKRRITFALQFSLDGPPEINDKSRRAGATENTIRTLKEILSQIEYSEYFTFQPEMKATFSLEMIENLTLNNKVQWWYDWCDKTCTDLFVNQNYASNINYDYICLAPTLVAPVLATVEQGKIFAKFINLICEVDTTNYYWYNRHPLFMAGRGQMQYLMRASLWDKDFLFNYLSCSAGKNNWHFEYDGTVSSCSHLSPLRESEDVYDKMLVRSHCSQNLNRLKELQMVWGEYGYHTDFATRYHMLSASALLLDRCHQIDHKYVENQDNLLYLWFVSTTCSCYISDMAVTGNESITTFGNLRLWGNGAGDALLRYYQYEKQRLDICH